MNEPVFFDSWLSLARVLLVGGMAYIFLIVLLRLSGKRTLSKMNAFDLIVTVALGSTLATVLLNRSVPLADGVLAFALLIMLQFVITWLSVRSRRFQSLVKAEPALLAKDGACLGAAMRAQRVTQEEVTAALREHGYANLDEIACIVLETDGSLSVIPKR